MATPVRLARRPKARPAASKATPRGKAMTTLEQVRRALADYMYSEGCGCCRNHEAHDKNKARLGELLGVPKFDDDSGYDFSGFRSPRRAVNQPREQT